MWRLQPAFTASLLGSLLLDLRRLVSQAGGGAGLAAAQGGDSWENDPLAPAVPPSLRQALGLAACVLPILDAAVDARLPGCQARLQELLAAFRSAASVPAACAAHAGVAAELAGHVARLAALAPAAAAAAAAVEERGAVGERVGVQLLVSGVRGLALADDCHAEAGPSPGSEWVQLRLRLDPKTAPAEGQASDPLQAPWQAVLAIVAAAVEQPAVAAQQSAVLALLAAVRAWVQVLIQTQQEGGQARAADAAAAALLASGPGCRSWLLALRRYSSGDVVLQAAQLVALLVQHSAAGLEAVLADAEDEAAAARPAAGREGAAALLFNLSVLQASVPYLAPAGLAAVWRRLYPLALSASGLAAGGAVQEQRSCRVFLQLLSLLRETADRLQAAGPHNGQADGPAAAAAPPQGVCRLVAHVLEAGAGSSGGGELEEVLLAALRWLQHVASWAERSEGEGSGVEAAADLAAALSAALASTASLAAAVRCAALSAARAWVCTSAGSAALLRDARLSSALLSAAVLHLSHLHPLTAAEAEQLLLAAAAPLALGCTMRSSDGRDGCADEVPHDAATAAALGPQQLQFKPVQLQQLLSCLAPGSSTDPPAVLTARAQPPAAGSLSEWLPRMLLYAQRAPCGAAPTHHA